jgi:mRNA interferase RelE/StbE
VSYRVQVAHTAARQLTEHLPEAVAAACVEFLYGPLADNPHRYWRARRGEYRVRYTIDETTRTVRVLDISHRLDAYH